MRCKDCGAERRTVKSPGPRCASCRRAKRNVDRDRAHERQVMKLYGLKEGEYAELYRAQGGKCALCRRATGRAKRLAVDHDHRCCPALPTCGKCNRGLLCGKCNSFLGHARDDLGFFARCANYLILYRAKYTSCMETKTYDLESRCQVRSMVATDQQQEVVDMILTDTDGYSDAYAARCISEVWLQIGEQAVAQHRVGKCECSG